VDVPEGAGDAETCGVSRVATKDMNNTKMTAPIAAPSVRFKALSSGDGELPFIPGERKGGTRWAHPANCLWFNDLWG
jgi:hypothetical protein